MMKRFLAFTLALFILLSSTVSAAGFDGDITAKSYCVIDLDTGRFLAKKDENVPLPPASLTKVMTALLALENCPDPANTIVTIPDDEIFKDVVEGNGARIWLSEGEQISLEALIYATMLPSACDAASAIAWYIGGGDMDKFFDMMNARAKEIGMVNTTFKNAHGLDEEGHISSAYDMALLALTALENEAFRKVISEYSYSIPANNKSGARFIKYTIRMLNTESTYYYEGATGVKSGFTYAAGRCLITTAKRDNEHFLSVVLGSSNDAGYNENLSYDDTAALLNWAFDTFEEQSAITVPPSVSVVHGKEKEVSAVFTEQVSALLANDEKFDVTFNMNESVEAPVTKGETVLGTAEVFVNGTKVAESTLVADKSVEALPYPKWASVFAWFGIHPFIILPLLILLIAAGGLYLRYKYVQAVKRRRRAMRRRMAHQQNVFRK